MKKHEPLIEKIKSLENLIILQEPKAKGDKSANFFIACTNIQIKEQIENYNNRSTPYIAVKPKIITAVFLIVLEGLEVEIPKRMLENIPVLKIKQNLEIEDIEFEVKALISKQYYHFT